MSALSTSRTLSATLGYDLELLAGLGGSAQHDLELTSAAWCWASAALSAPLSYAAWLLTHSAWLSLAGGLGGLLMLLQIVRLTVAGTGLSVSASAEVVRDYRPAWTPLLWFALLGAMFAQPAQLPLWQREHGALVAAERSKLLAVHARALQSLLVRGKTARFEALPADPTAASHDSFERELGDNEFLVLRLCSLWSSPRRAARYTALYLLIALGPLVLAQLHGRRALCRYQRLRVRLARRTIAADRRRTEQRIDAALARYTSYAPRSSSASRTDFALRSPWPVARVQAEASS